MTLLYGPDVPDVSVTKDGAIYRLPVQQQGSDKSGYRPVPVARSPKLTFPPPIAIAGPEGGQYRRNYDIDELIQATWEGGMGDETVAAGVEVRGSQWGRLDTRWPNVVTNRPGYTLLGASVSGMDPAPTRVVELGYANATLLWYSASRTAGAGFKRYTGLAWTAVQSAATSFTTSYDHAQGLNGLVITGTCGAVGTIFRSSDGVTYTAMADGAMTTPVNIAIFDEKVWALDWGAPTNGAYAVTAYSSADFWSAAGGAGTWTAGAATVMPSTEYVNEFFVWQYPPDRGKPTLWMLTTCRLLYYDYYASTPAWREWFVFQSTQQGNTTLYSTAVVNPRNGNLYVGIYGREWLWEFTGNTIERPSPNRRHGLPTGTRLSPYHLAANESGVYAFCGPHPADPTSPGALVYMDEGKNFHHLFDQSGLVITGGGVGATKLYPATTFTGSNGRCWQVDNPDALAVPPYVTGRTFDTTAATLQSGWLNMGLLNVNKRLLQFEVDCIKADGTKGLDANAQAQMEYRGRGSASWTSAGTLTSTDTFPAVLAIAGGWTFKEMQYRLTLSGSATPPLVRAVKIGYRPRPKQRYTYTVRVDLRDGSPAFMTDDEMFRGYSASKLRAVLDELADSDDAGLDDTLVGLAYGGHGNTLHPRRRSASQCEVSIQSQESPDGGDGLYLLIFNSLEASTSG